MPVVAFALSFGSFGDFGTLLGLTHALAVKLWTIDPLQTEHRALQREVQLLEMLLVRALSPSPSPSPSDPDIQRRAQTCGTLVKSVHVRLEDMERASRAGSWRKAVRKVRICLLPEEEVRIYKEQLRDARLKLSTALERRDLDSAVSRAGALGPARRLKTLGYPWEGGIAPGREPVEVRGATGETLAVPIEFTANFKVLTDVMMLSMSTYPWSELARGAEFIYTSSSPPSLSASSSSSSSPPSASSSSSLSSLSSPPPVSHRVEVINGEIHEYPARRRGLGSRAFPITPGMRLALTLELRVHVYAEWAKPAGEEREGGGRGEEGVEEYVEKRWRQVVMDVSTLVDMIRGDHPPCIRAALEYFRRLPPSRPRYLLKFVFPACGAGCKAVEPLAKTHPGGDVTVWEFAE